MANEPTLYIYPVPTGTTPKEGQGVLFIVTGPVSPDAQVVVSGVVDGLGHYRSPVFGMKNRVVKTSAEWDLSVANATGGTFYLYGDDGTIDFPQTADIPFNASAADVQTAIRALWGQQSVIATGGPLGTEAVTLVFTDAMREKDIDLSVNDDSLTGGGSEAATLSEVTAGGADSTVLGGPYAFGPIQLKVGVSGDVHVPLAYSADVVYGYSDDSAGTSLLAAPTTFYVYPYSDDYLLL